MAPNQAFNADSLQRGILLRKILCPTANRSAGRPAPLCRLTWRCSEKICGGYLQYLQSSWPSLAVFTSGCFPVEATLGISKHSLRRWWCVPFWRLLFRFRVLARTSPALALLSVSGVGSWCRKRWRRRSILRLRSHGQHFIVPSLGLWCTAHAEAL